MPRFRRCLPLALMAPLFLAPLSAAHADDRPPTDAERGQIEEQLRVAGFTRWDQRIDLDDGRWEVDDAVGPDGIEYDVELDMEFRIVRREPD